ncbi:type 1 fimbrial protein, partial [Escherichia coli]|nr:type 1 fimbrial protein [Escherichia coli]
VGIQLLDKDKHELKINVPTTIALMPGTQTIAFYARLKASYALTGQASPTPGAVQSVINVTFSYN